MAGVGAEDGDAAAGLMNEAGGAINILDSAAPPVDVAPVGELEHSSHSAAHVAGLTAHGGSTTADAWSHGFDGRDGSLLRGHHDHVNGSGGNGHLTAVASPSPLRAETPDVASFAGSMPANDDGVTTPSSTARALAPQIVQMLVDSEAPSAGLATSAAAALDSANALLRRRSPGGASTAHESFFELPSGPTSPAFSTSAPDSRRLDLDGSQLRRTADDVPGSEPIIAPAAGPSIPAAPKVPWPDQLNQPAKAKAKAKAKPRTRGRAKAKARAKSRRVDPIPPSQRVSKPGSYRGQTKSSKYVGVRKHTGGRWQAQIRRDGKMTYLGLFETEEEAARAHDAKAVELGRPPPNGFTPKDLEDLARTASARVRRGQVKRNKPAPSKSKATPGAEDGRTKPARSKRVTATKSSGRAAAAPRSRRRVSSVGSTPEVAEPTGPTLAPAKGTPGIRLPAGISDLAASAYSLSSRFTGVRLNNATGQWQAFAADPDDGKVVNLGLFEGEAAAAAAYDVWCASTGSRPPNGMLEGPKGDPVARDAHAEKRRRDDSDAHGGPAPATRARTGEGATANGDINNGEDRSPWWVGHDARVAPAAHIQ